MDYLLLQSRMINCVLRNQLLTRSFLLKTILQGAYDLGSLNNEIRKIIFEEKQITEAKYQSIIKPKFSTLGSIIETSRKEPLISFLPEDSVRSLLGFFASTIFEE